MRLNKILNFTKWIMVWLSVSSLTTSPLAMGSEAHKVTKQQMQSYIKQLGLNHKMTLGEFFEKNKYLFSKKVLDEVQPMFEAYKDQPMPEFTVGASKSPLGEEIPTIRVAGDNGDLINVQWFGEQDKMVKVQNVNLSQVDVINFEDMYVRLINGDSKFKRQAVQPVAQVVQEDGFGPELPTPNQKEWNSMSTADKASYVVNLRSLWMDARRVLDAQNQLKAKSKKNKKTSLNVFEKYQFFFALLNGWNAEATARISCGAAEGQSCIIAGYTSTYTVVGNRCTCQSPADINSIFNRRDNQNQYTIHSYAVTQCRNTGIPCNPYIFGTPNGRAICVPSNELRDATTWTGKCDRGARLQDSDTQVSASELFTNATDYQHRYDASNLKPDARARILQEETTSHFAQTKSYLQGVLKFIHQNDPSKNYGDVDHIFDDNQTISQQVLDQLLVTKATFDREISAAKDSCKQNANTGTSKNRVDRRYWDACDQLHARYLFIEDFLKSKCASHQIDQGTFKCTCENNAAPVLPGATCGTGTPAAAPAVTPVPAAAPAAAAPPAAPAPAAPSARDNHHGGGSSIFSKLWNGVKAIAPYVITAGVIYLLYKMMSPKKPALTNPADVCPNGNTANCYQTCAPPLAANGAGGCACPLSPCSDGTSVNGVQNGTSCSYPSCGSSSTGGTGAGNSSGTTMVCPDSVTSVSCGTLAVGDCINQLCPNYSCWNGKSYKSTMQCPPKQTTSNTTSGGSSPTGGVGTGR